METHQPQVQLSNGNVSLEQNQPTSAIVYNPLLLSIPTNDQMNGNGSSNRIHRNSSDSTNLTECGFNSSMHINVMFDDVDEPVRYFRKFSSEKKKKRILFR